MEDKNRGHVWKLDEYGCVDDFGLDVGYHNGPICVRCHYSYCEHCHAGPQEDCDYVDQLELPV